MNIYGIQNNFDNSIFNQQTAKNNFIKFAGEPVNPVEGKLDSADLSQKKAKKGNPFINFVSNVAKAFASFGEITKGIVKGLIYGTLTYYTAKGGAWLFDSLPRGFKELSKNDNSDVAKQAFKSVSKKGKFISGILGAGVLSYHVIKGILNKNKKTASIDHQLKTGHRA